MPKDLIVPEYISDLHLQLHGFHLTTAKILYHMPDHPLLLQSFVWQDYDRVPQLPILRDFIHFWQGNIEGRLHSVDVWFREHITDNPLNIRSFELELV